MSQDGSNHASAENSTPQALPALKHLTQEQPLLLELPPESRKPAREPDPLAKPTWEEWKAMDVFRRLLTDRRLRGHDQAFKLWHHYHNSKDRGGRVSGPRAEAWYIARKYGWKAATVYAANKLLAECGFLTWWSGKGNSNTFEIRHGLGEVRSNNQEEMPFLVPLSSAHKGTSAMPQGNPSSAHKGTSAMPLEAQPLNSESTCEISVKKPRGMAREPGVEIWKIYSDIKQVTELIRQIANKANLSEVDRRRLAGLKAEKERLEDKLPQADIVPGKNANKDISPKPSAAPDKPLTDALPGTPEYERAMKQAGLK